MNSKIAILAAIMAHGLSGQALAQTGELYLINEEFGGQGSSETAPFENVPLGIYLRASEPISAVHFRVVAPDQARVGFTPPTLVSGYQDINPSPDGVEIHFDPPLEVGVAKKIAALDAHPTDAQPNARLVLAGANSLSPQWLPAGLAGGEAGWLSFSLGIFGTEFAFNCSGEYHCCNLLVAHGVDVKQPLPGQVVVSGEPTIVTWQLFGETPGPREVLVSYSDGLYWESVGTTADTTLVWTPPDLDSHVARIKVRPPGCIEGLSGQFQIQRSVRAGSGSFGVLKVGN